MADLLEDAARIIRREARQFREDHIAWKAGEMGCKRTIWFDADDKARHTEMIATARKLEARAASEGT